MRKILAILISIVFLISNKVLAQTSDSSTYTSLQKLIPQDRKLYFIGEFHIDKFHENVDDPLLDSLINIASVIEDSIRRILTENCNVKTYLLEYPVSFEYYINNFFITGDDLWLDACLLGTYQKNKIKSIRNIALDKNEIEIKCIDAESKFRYENVLDVLFFMTFLETVDLGNQKLHSSPISYSNEYLQNRRYQGLFSESTHFNDTLITFFRNFDRICSDFSGKNSLALYKLLKNAKKDSVLQQCLRNYYQHQYPYFTRLTESFLTSYNLKYKEEKTKSFWTKRETIMFQNLSNIMKEKPNSNYCLQIGNAHVLPNSNFENIHIMVERTLNIPVYNITMIPNFYYDSDLFESPFCFDFEGQYKYERVSENGMHYLIK